MSKPKRKRYVVVPGQGGPCPRCCQPTQIREHSEVTEKHRRQPFYFSRWFHCTNPQCKAQMICPERFKVWNPHLNARRRDNLERWLVSHHAQKREQRAVMDSVDRGQLVLWGDAWPDEAPTDTSGSAPWE